MEEKNYENQEERAGAELQEKENKRDLGVNILADLSPDMDRNVTVRAAYAFLANVRVAFRQMDKEISGNIYVTY
ncbi:hypothetical protein SK128_000138, partial [Halocaridina rubra]